MLRGESTCPLVNPLASIRPQYRSSGRSNQSASHYPQYLSDQPTDQRTTLHLFPLCLLTKHQNHPLTNPAQSYTAHLLSPCNASLTSHPSLISAYRLSVLSTKDMPTQIPPMKSLFTEPLGEAPLGNSYLWDTSHLRNILVVSVTLLRICVNIILCIFMYVRARHDSLAPSHSHLEPIDLRTTRLSVRPIAT